MGAVAAAREGARAHDVLAQGGDGANDVCTDLSGSNSFSSYSCDGNCYGPGGVDAPVDCVTGDPFPTAQPTAQPTTADPTAQPTDPTAKPTAEPTAEPTAPPTADPTVKPTADPTAPPTADPTAPPTAQPTFQALSPTAPTAEKTECLSAKGYFEGLSEDFCAPAARERRVASTPRTRTRRNAAGEGASRRRTTIVAPLY